MDEGKIAGVDRHDLYGPELLMAVAHQLKQPFLHVAHGLEIARGSDDASAVFDTIETAVARGIRLLESYILSMQTGPGQTEFLLEPVSVSSVLYDVAHNLSRLAKEYECELELEIGGRFGPVMSNKEALSAGLLSVGEVFLASSGQLPSKQRQVVLATNKTRGHIKVGVFGAAEGLGADMRRTKLLQGRARAPLSTFGDSSAAGVMVADMLFAAMNTPLRASRYNKQEGLAVSLLPSRQLSLVTA